MFSVAAGHLLQAHASLPHWSGVEVVDGMGEVQARQPAGGRPSRSVRAGVLCAGVLARAAHKKRDGRKPAGQHAVTSTECFTSVLTCLLARVRTCPSKPQAHSGGGAGSRSNDQGRVRRHAQLGPQQGDPNLAAEASDCTPCR